MKSLLSQAIAQRVAVVALVVASIVTLTSCSDRKEQYDYLRLQVNGQPILSISRKDHAVRGVVVFFHGIDGDEFATTSDKAHQDMTGTLVDAGFAVVSSRADGNEFNDPDTKRSYRELGSMAMQHYGTERIYFLAESFGAIPAMGLLAEEPAVVRGLAAINPALNFESSNSKWPALGSAQAGHGSPTGDPMSLPHTALKDANVRFYMSPDDSLVRSEMNSLAFEERFGSSSEISVVKCSGDHGDASCLQGGDLVKWFKSL